MAIAEAGDVTQLGPAVKNLNSEGIVGIVRLSTQRQRRAGLKLRQDLVAIVVAEAADGDR